jgi:Predicted ornithine cyclodeaminase, mu-crystallin homolog
MNTNIDILYLSEKDMIDAGVLDVHRCIEVMTEMFSLLSKGDYVMGSKNRSSHGIMMDFPDRPEFPNMPANGPDRRFMAMPAYIGGRFDVCGTKWYGSNKENLKKGLPRSILMNILNDKDTGAPIAFQSANLVSAVRTGCISGVAAKFLAKRDSDTLGVIGPGVVSKLSAAAILDACPGITKVKICGRRMESARSFSDYITEKYPQVRETFLTLSMEEAVRGSDVVLIATSGAAADPDIQEEWIKKGALFTLPASVRLDDEFIVKRARNVVDHWKMYEAWRNEYDYPYYKAIDMLAVYYLDLIHDGKMEERAIDNLGDIISGTVGGRKSDDEIILFTTGGIPTEDVAWGYELYRNALRLGLGTRLNLWDTPAMI